MKIATPLLALCLLGLAYPAAAQVPADAAVRLREDQHGLVRYAWTMRTEILRSGESLGWTVEHLRFSDQGTVTRTMVTDERTNAARKKKILERVERIVMTAIPYVVPDPEQVQRFLDAAEVVDGEAEVRIRGEGFLAPHDLVEIGIEKEGWRIAWMSVVAPLDHDSLKVRATYEVLPDGTNAVVQITADHRAGDVRLTMDNSEFVRLR